jgi:hypothetical protein
MYNPCAAMKGVPITILDAQTVDETVSTVVVPGSAENHTFYLRSSAAITGAVTLETAPTPDYAGLWSPLEAAIDVATIGASAGVLKKSYTGIFGAVRARISTVIAGGTLSVDYVTN